MTGMTPQISKSVRIGLLGMYASRNLGDVAIQIAVMNALRMRRKDIEFVGLCQDPEDTVRTFGIPAFASSGHGHLILPESGRLMAESPRVAGEAPVPSFFGQFAVLERIRHRLVESRISRFLGQFGAMRQIRRQMQSLDMLLVSGSGQVDDYWGGPWAQPFRLMAWSMAARSQGKPVAVFGVGVDELSTRLGAWFSVRALNCAQLCVLRDTGSRDAIRDMGFSGQMDVCADPAFSIVAVPSEIDKSPATPYAVISPISRRAWPGAEDEAYSAYLTALAAAADFLQNQSVQVRFVCSQTSMDPRIVDRIKQRMQGDPLAAIAVGVKTFEEYLTAVQGARVVIGSRLHALILALVAGTPVIAVSGVRKVHQLFADLDLSDHAFDIRSLHIAPLLGRIETVIRDHVAMKEHVRNKTREFRPQLDTHFDKLARLIPSSPGGC